MNEKEFKKHLHDLAHGHHHPEEHDWTDAGARPKQNGDRVATTTKRKAATRTAKKRKK